MLLRVLRRLAVLLVSLVVSSVAGVRVHGGAAGRPGPGRARRQRVGRGGGRSCARSSGSTDRSSRSTSTGSAAWSPSTSGTSYVSKRGDRAADRRPAPGHAVAGRHGDGRSPCVIAVPLGHRSWRCGTAGRPGSCSRRSRRSASPSRRSSPGILLITRVRGAAGVAAGQRLDAAGEDPVMFLKQLMLPALSLGLVQGAVLTRYVRSRGARRPARGLPAHRPRQGLTPDAGAAAARAAQRGGARW